MKSFSFLPAAALLVALAGPAAHLEAKVGALGRILPAGDLLHLTGADVVAVVHVNEGDVVDAGAPLITFAGEQAAKNEVVLAELALREAEELGRLSLEALTLKTRSLKHDYDFTKLRHDRFNKLGGEELSPQQMELRAYQMKTSELALNSGEKDLERSAEERRIKIEKARVQLEVAREKLKATTLRSPARLTVIKINSLPGAIPSGAAITLANLSEMHVSSEVFAGDLPALKLDQEATITSSALPGPLKGRVLRISRLITGRAKVGEVLLRLDDPTAASKLINLEVNVSIEN